MKRPLRPEEARLWGVITATVRPGHGRSHTAEVAALPAATVIVTKTPPKFAGKRVVAPGPIGPAPVKRKAAAPAPAGIEPNRQRRIARLRDDLDARLDLHGLDQDAARATLHAFVLRAQAQGYRAVLVITGKGSLGDGILRRRTPEWLAEPQVRHAVAGISEAHRHHGGAGALYVALKRKG